MNCPKCDREDFVITRYVPWTDIPKEGDCESCGYIDLTDKNIIKND